MAKGSETHFLPFEIEQGLKALGAHLERCRLARGDTLSTVAERCGVHVQTISRIEKGDPAVSIGKVFALLHLYGQAGRLFDLSKTDEATEILYQRMLPSRGWRSMEAQR